MGIKIKRISMIIGLAVVFYFSERLFTAFLVINWAIEEIQKKNGYKDMGEQKYDIEDLLRMAMTIPRYTILSGPEIKKLFPLLSKEHVYKLIDLRKRIDQKNPDAPHFWELHRKMIIGDIT